MACYKSGRVAGGGGKRLYVLHACRSRIRSLNRCDIAGRGDPIGAFSDGNSVGCETNQKNGAADKVEKIYKGFAVGTDDADNERGSKGRRPVAA
jgi:hypothetical protein